MQRWLNHVLDELPGSDTILTATRRSLLRHILIAVHHKSCIREGINVSREAQNRYNGVALSMAEISMLQELEGLLQERGHLHAGACIPVISKDEEDSLD